MEATVKEAKALFGKVKKTGIGGIGSMFKSAAKKMASGQADGFAEELGNFIGNEEDPLSYDVAYAMPKKAEVTYSTDNDITDHHKPMSYYKCDCRHQYGTIIPIGEGLYKEVVFTIPNEQYSEAKMQDINLTGVPFWKREDNSIHKARVYIISADRDKAETYAAMTSFAKELEKFYEIDYSTSRDQLAPVLGMSDLYIDAKSGVLELSHIDAYYLPIRTKEGRNIQYGWDALRVYLYKDGQLVKRAIANKTNLQSVNNTFGIMDNFGTVEPGEYQLVYCIYEDEIKRESFTVKYQKSQDPLSHPEFIYALETTRDQYVDLQGPNDAWLVSGHFPIRMLFDSHFSDEKVKIAYKMSKNGENFAFHPDGEYLFTPEEHEIRNTPDWPNNTVNLHLMLHSDSCTYEDVEQDVDGNYTLHIYVNDKVYADIHFSVRDLKLVVPEYDDSLLAQHAEMRMAGQKDFHGQIKLLHRIIKR